MVHKSCSYSLLSSIALVIIVLLLHSLCVESARIPYSSAVASSVYLARADLSKLVFTVLGNTSTHVSPKPEAQAVPSLPPVFSASLLLPSKTPRVSTSTQTSASSQGSLPFLDVEAPDIPVSIEVDFREFKEEVTSTPEASDVPLIFSMNDVQSSKKNNLLVETEEPEFSAMKGTPEPVEVETPELTLEMNSRATMVEPEPSATVVTPEAEVEETPESTTNVVVLLLQGDIPQTTSAGEHVAVLAPTQTSAPVTVVTVIEVREVPGIHVTPVAVDSASSKSYRTSQRSWKIARDPTDFVALTSPRDLREVPNLVHLPALRESEKSAEAPSIEPTEPADYTTTPEPSLNYETSMGELKYNTRN